MTTKPALKGVIVGFIVKNADSGETETVKRGDPRFDVCVTARELMAMHDLNELCRDEIEQREGLLEKQAEKINWHLLGQQGQRVEKAYKRRPAIGAAIGAISALGSKAIIDKIRKKRSEKRAAYQPHEDNRSLLDYLRSKTVGDDSEDA